MADMVAVVMMMLALLSGSAMTAPVDDTYAFNKTDTSEMKRPSVRLVDGSSNCSGRLEFFHEDQWGTVCDDSWDLTDAQVVCRELGCGRALQAPARGHFGMGSGLIWLDEVHCQGGEWSLADCSHSGFGDHDCFHNEDAGVVCEGAVLMPTPDTTTADYEYTVPPLEVQVVHFLLGRTGEVRGYADPVKFDLVVDDSGHGFEKTSHFGYDRDSGVFTAPFQGEYRLSLSAALCLGSRSSIWVFLVNDRVEEGCMVHSGQLSRLCTHWTWLQAGDRLRVRQQSGCSWGITFSGNSWESNWYDMYY